MDKLYHNKVSACRDAWEYTDLNTSVCLKVLLFSPKSYYDLNRYPNFIIGINGEGDTIGVADLESDLALKKGDSVKAHPGSWPDFEKDHCKPVFTISRHSYENELTCKVKTVYYGKIAASNNASCQDLHFDEADFENATVSYSRKDVPHSFIKALRRSAHSRLRLVDSLKNKSDAYKFGESHLTREFAMLVTFKRGYLLTYIHGGMGVHGHCIVYEKASDNSFKVTNLQIWRYEAQSFNDLKTALIKNEYSFEDELHDY